MDKERHDHDDGHVEEALRRSKAIREDAEALAGELRAAADQARSALDIQGRMERHPYATMAAAVGIGYVLGGGLFTRLSARMLHLGARVLLVPLIRSELQAFGESAMGRAAGEGFGGGEGGSEDL
jgi:predicted methyltransferase